MNRCRTCRARIVWATLPSGRRMPVDSDPSPVGQIRLDGTLGVVLGEADATAARLAGEPLFISHFATCPDASEHRRGKENR